MRLIDADKLIEVLHESLEGDCDLREDYEFMGIDEFIKNQPTAYDVDKVVEELKGELQRTYYEATSKHGSLFSLGENTSYQKAIEIVKAGGIDGNTNT